MIQKTAAMGNWWLAASSQQHACSCIASRAEFLAKHQITQVTQSPYSPDLARCDFWLFPKLKLPLKGKRFQAVDEVQENTMEQLMAIGRTVWGPKVPPLRGTEASLFMYNVSCVSYIHSVSAVCSAPSKHWRYSGSQEKARSLHEAYLILVP